MKLSLCETHRLYHDDVMFYCCVQSLFTCCLSRHTLSSTNLLQRKRSLFVSGLSLSGQWLRWLWYLPISRWLDAEMFSVLHGKVLRRCSVRSRVNGRAHAANQSQIVLANQIFFPHEYSFSQRLPATVIPLSEQGVRVSNPPGLKLKFVDPRLTQ